MLALLSILTLLHLSTASNLTIPIRDWKSDDRLLQRVHLTGTGNGLAPLDTKVLAGDATSSIAEVRIYQMIQKCNGVTVEHVKSGNDNKHGIHVRVPKDCSVDYMVEIYGSNR